MRVAFVGTFACRMEPDVRARLGGAALDAWYRYPVTPGATLPADRPFHERPNVLLTPHVSGWTDGMLRARATLIAANIARVSRGERPENLIQTN